MATSSGSPQDVTSGRHREHETTPGSRSSSPSKKRTTCSGVRWVSLGVPCLFQNATATVRAHVAICHAVVARLIVALALVCTVTPAPRGGGVVCWGCAAHGNFGEKLPCAAHPRAALVLFQISLANNAVVCSMIGDRVSRSGRERAPERESSHRRRGARPHLAQPPRKHPVASMRSSKRSSSPPETARMSLVAGPFSTS